MIEWTGLDLYQVMSMNVVEFFNLTLFNMDWNEFQRQQMKKMMTVLPKMKQLKRLKPPEQRT